MIMMMMMMMMMMMSSTRQWDGLVYSYVGILFAKVKYTLPSQNKTVPQFAD
jgi:hypothetical protein